jgi:hypothetical protein
MKFTEMTPIGRGPEIEIIKNGECWDLHNCAEFIGHKINEDEYSIILSWNYGCNHEGIISGNVSLNFSGVSNLEISDKDQELPRDEDGCLEEIRMDNNGTICVSFRGGQSFKISCSEVSFHSNNTRGHRV